jgi:phosphatidate phosphatase APP1
VQLHPRFNGTWPCNEEVLDGLTVRLFPGYAQQLDDNEWLISLRGWVCDSEIRSVRRRLMSGVLQRGVWNAVHGAQGEGDAEEEPAPPARLKRLALLRRRVSVFLTKSHPSVRVPLELTTSEGAQLWSSATNSVGHFSVHAAVPQAQLLCSSGARQLPGGSWLTTVRTTPTADGRVFESAMLCIPPVGVSVISDIDDTIKLTHVHNTRLMLRATFLDEWLAVPGMPELYRDWANQGASFHYVSSSPWQLQQPLEALLVKAGFPPGERRWTCGLPAAGIDGALPPSRCARGLLGYSSSRLLLPLARARVHAHAPALARSSARPPACCCIPRSASVPTAGTFHLKDLHYKGRRLLNLFRSSTALKPTQIEKLLKSFPLRTFVLVGDAGEKDPLVRRAGYALARRLCEARRGARREAARALASFLTHGARAHPRPTRCRVHALRSMRRSRAGIAAGLCTSTSATCRISKSAMP